MFRLLRIQRRLVCAVPPPARAVPFPYTARFRPAPHLVAGHRTRPGTARRITAAVIRRAVPGRRSEEHTSELQSRGHIVCRLQLEKATMKHIGLVATDECHEAGRRADLVSFADAS